MRPLPDSPDQVEDGPRPSWLRRIGWLALIWALSAAALYVVALGFKAVMGWVGLTV